MALSFHTDDERSAKGIILDDCVTAETAAALTGYNIQHVRRLAYEGKLEAVRVGLEMRAADEEVVTGRWGEVEEMPFRAGIATGLVLLSRHTGTGSSTPSGATITLASKVKDAAPPGAVLVAYDTFTLVRGIFDFQPEDPIRVKGREPVEVFVALRARPRAFFRGQQRGIEGVETAMIGREPQMQILQDAISLMLEIHASRS